MALRASADFFSVRLPLFFLLASPPYRNFLFTMLLYDAPIDFTILQRKPVNLTIKETSAVNAPLRYLFLLFFQNSGAELRVSANAEGLERRVGDMETVDRGGSFVSPSPRDSTVSPVSSPAGAPRHAGPVSEATFVQLRHATRLSQSALRTTNGRSTEPFGLALFSLERDTWTGHICTLRRAAYTLTDSRGRNVPT